MTISASTKIRAFGGASALALTAGLVSAGLAQEAETEQAAECTLDSTATPNTLICGPGIDPDGFQQDLDDVVVSVEEGAQVQGLIQLGDNISATVAGEVTVTSDKSALEFGDDATISNNGTVSALGERSSAIRVGDDALIVNSSTIFVANLTALDPFAGASVRGTDEGGVFAGDGLSLTNNAGGTIIANASNAITSGAAVRAGDDAVITNAGEISSSSDGVNAISVGDGLSLTNSGTIEAVDRAIEAGDDASIVNSGTIESADRAINAGDDVTITNEMGGLINTTGDADTIQTGDNLIIINNGTISNEGFDTKIIDAGDGLTVTNNGTITSDWKGVEGEANFTLTNNEGGLIFSTNDEAVEADGPGLVVVNRGQIISPQDDAVDGGDNVTITNFGLIRGGQNDGLELNSGTITNSGTIESLSSDPDGSLIIGGTTPELDAAIDFDAGTPGNEDGVVFNLATGVIIGDIAINTSSGNQDSPEFNLGRQEIFNFGSITGRAANTATGGRIDAVLLGEGDDAFFKLNGGVESGVVDGEGGFDTFSNVITDTTNRSFNLDLIGTQYVGFEDFSFGSQIFDFVNQTATGAPAATGVLTLTGATNAQLNIVNTATLSGTVMDTTVVLLTENGTGINRVFTITPDGEIAAEGDGIEVVDDGWTINNAGSITGGDDGIEGGDDLTIANTGTITADDRAIDVGDNLVLTNSGTISSVDRAVNAGAGVTITNDAGGLITTTGDNDTIQTDENLTVVNNGTISNSGFDTKIIDAGDGLTVTNNGLITSDWKGIEGEGNFTLTNNAGARIFSTNDEAVEADGPGLVVVNNGEIIAPKDDAIDGGADVTITNTGLIRGGENDGMELDSGTITNSGIIESLSSDPEGAFSDADFTNRELDAGIDFDGVDDPENLAGPETDTVTNLAGGIIRGDIGINASSGNFGEPDLGDTPSPANVRSQTIVNFGEITANLVNPVTGRRDAVLLSFGDDEFQQWDAGVTNGTVDGEGGNDRLIFGNSTEGTTTRSLDAISDPALYTGFEFYGLLDTGGALALTGESAVAFSILGGDIILEGDLTNTITADGEGSLTVTETGSITVDDGDAVEVDVDGFAISNAGTIAATDGRAIDARGVDGTTITNSGTIEAFDRAIDAGDDVTITNEMGGLINTTGDDDTIQTGDNLTIINNGTISNEGFDTKIIDAGDGLTVTNNGTITSDWKGIEGEANFTLTNNEGGLIFSTNDEAVEADDAGLTVVNNGEIIAPKDDAIDGGADVTITNTGLIRGGENDGMELDSGTITNSGIIESLSSDPEGAFSDADFTNRELDAGIDFDGVDDPENLAGPETDTVTNLAGGIIRGDIGINASSGNFGEPDLGDTPSPANVRSQTIVNFGEITANLVNPVTGRRDAVLLSFGDDEFQQWTGAIVNGWVDLEGGDDLFILEGVSSSLTSGITGGDGDDTAILAGILDSDNLFSFETIQLGSQLGGTLNDLEVVGNRSLTGDLVHVGIVNISLGVDSLTTTGSITLEETGVLNIATPLNQELLGQTVLVLQEGEGEAFTNNGATVNVIDNDLLLDYRVVLGSLSVQVNLASPVASNPDANIAGIGNAVGDGLTNGTLSDGAFTVLNALPDAAAYSAALKDALPSLSDGVGREIFETGSLASQALERHLKGENSGVWGQIATRGVSQDARSQSVDGYESNQLVFTVGGDIALGDATRVGLMASYADIDVDDETATGAPTNSQEVKSTRIGIYVASTLFDRGFINSEISYLTGDVNSARGGFFGPITSAYDFDGIATRTALGYDLLADENISFTPTIGLNSAQIKFDDAVEVGGFGFTVQQGDATFLETRFGLELGAQMSEGVNVFAQGVVVHDLVDDPRSLRLSSSQLTSFFVSQPMREQDRFELSAGASIDVSENFAIELGYLGDYSEGYNAHSARASVRIGF